MPAWSLLLFTLLVQTCVGTLVWIEVMRLSVADRKLIAPPDSVILRLMSGISVGTGVAVVISLLHLGSPLKAVFALHNLGTSWLSREVLLVLLFGCGIALATLMRQRGWGSEAARVFVSRSSALLGLVLVYVMARLYMLPTTPAWNTAATPISFFSTSMILGGCVMLASLMQSKSDWFPPENAREFIVWTLILFLGGEIVLTLIQAGVLYGHPMVIDHGSRFAALNTLLVVRVLCVVLALACLIKYLYRSSGRPERWILTTLVLILFAEFLERYLFYAFYYRIGV